jgi:hypothetical protein
METQKAEFDALHELCMAYKALPAIVDDAYPKAREEYELIIRHFLLACRANGRGLGATGEFPEGKLNPSDEGALKMAVGYDPLNGVVHIEFGTPVAWLGLPPDNAIEFALLVMRHAGVRQVEYERLERKGTKDATTEGG